MKVISIDYITGLWSKFNDHCCVVRIENNPIVSEREVYRFTVARELKKFNAVVDYDRFCLTFDSEADYTWFVITYS